MVYKREDWNSLIQEVNEILQDPPDGCDPIDPLDEVPPMHRWAKSDIRDVQDKLKETCEDITFDDIPDLWKQSIIDEIESKYEETWCDCECETDEADAEHGTVFFIRSNPSTVVSPCLGNDGDIPICDLIEGMQIALAGYNNRRWIFRFQRIGKDAFPRTITTGDVDCDGKVVCDTTRTIPVAGGDGIYVGCSNCESASCADTIADALAEIAADISTGDKAASIDYTLRLSVIGTDCCEEEETP